MKPAIAPIQTTQQITIPVYLQCLLLLLLVVSAYSPAFFAELCSIDDLNMIDGIRRSDDFNLLSILLPKAGEGLYYRPVIHLSYLLDLYLCGLNILCMHAHNVALHLVNGVLVFIIARRLVPRTSLAPLVIAILFGIHPLTTESVNWISGRTDLLSGFFLLLSTVLLLRYRETGARSYGYLVILCMLFGVLAKEFALAFVPGALLLVTARSGQTTEPERLRTARSVVIATVIISLLVVGSFFALRLIAFPTNSSKIVLTLKFMLVDPLHTAQVFMGAYAFYLKKIFIPWPLNFAIVEIDPLYELLAIPLLLLTLRVLVARTVASALFITGILLLTPSFVIAFNQIAWTPYAERYAYLSTAYILIAVGSYVSKRLLLKDRHEKLFGGVLVLILVVVTAVGTIRRNLVWQSNLAIVTDTINKSPGMADLRYLYGALLVEQGNYVGAIAQLEQGKRLPGMGYDQRFDLAIAGVYQLQHEYDKALVHLEEAVTRTKGRTEQPLCELAVQLTRTLKFTNDTPERYGLGIRIIGLYQQLYRLGHDPALFRDMAEVARSSGDTVRADRFTAMYTRLSTP